MHRIGIISAPLARQNQKYPRLTIDLERLVHRRGVLFVTNTFEELDKALNEFKRCGVSIIAINGGDGTISHVITAAIRIYGVESLPLFVPLRGGNFNVLAENLGIKLGPRHSLRKLVDLTERPERMNFKSLRTLEVNGQYGFLFANGTASRFLEHFYKNKASPIHSVKFILQLAISRMMTRKMFSQVVRSTQTKLEMDGEQVYDRQAVSVICSTMPRMTLGSHIFPETGGPDKPFQAVTFDTDAEDTFSKAVCDTYLHPRTSPNRSTYCGRALTIEQDPEDISSYTLDGELYFPEQNEVRINLGPALEFCTI